LNDILQFACPDKDLSSDPKATDSTLFEKALLLDYSQAKDYYSCNATSKYYN